MLPDIPFLRCSVIVFGVLVIGGAMHGGPAGVVAGSPWARHVIDSDGRGADGTKLGDLNGDGRLDIVSGWEEDGSTRVYFNPGPERAKSTWPKVIVGATPSAEDAVFVDLDGDGRLDVVTSTEGESRRVFVQWGPTRERLLEPEAWQQAAFPAVAGVTRWMFAEPIQFDGRHGVDLVIGGRRAGTSQHSFLGWLEAPAQPRDVQAWKWHPLLEVGWTMTIDIEDMDGDGDADILFSDRLEQARGIYWLENPGSTHVPKGAAWARHAVGATTVYQVMLLGLGDLDGDGRSDIVAPVQSGKVEAGNPNEHSAIAWFQRLDASGRKWTEHTIAVPENTGNVKHAAVGDIDGDGRTDLVVSCENAKGARIGVYWLRGDDLRARTWQAFDISGAPGIKFDLVRLLDLDADGDLDVLTNEEQEAGRGLGVVWYENPAGRKTNVGKRMEK